MADATLAEAFQLFSDQIGLISTADLVCNFDGENLGKFNDWISAVEKFSVVYGISDCKTKFVAYRASSGIASDFIRRFLEGNQNSSWQQLKDELINRFGEVRDTHHRFSLLKNIRQENSETVQTFAERIISIAETAYTAFDLNSEIVDHQLKGFFTDGLWCDDLKESIIRADPKTFKETVQFAVNEQNLKQRIKLRSGTPVSGTERGLNQSKVPGIGLNRGRLQKLENKRKFCRECFKKGHTLSECFKNTNFKNKGTTKKNAGAKKGSRQSQVNSVRNDNSCVKATHPQAFRSKVMCSFCRKLGHMQRDCYQYKHLTGRTTRQWEN